MALSQHPQSECAHHMYHQNGNLQTFTLASLLGYHRIMV
jgi:hypothetical protein